MPAQLDRLYVRASPWKALGRLVGWSLFEGRPLTTRGRWINPLVFALYGLQRRLPQLRDAERPIFVVGTGRSGTTVLGTVLSLHREVAFLNEPKALWHAVLPDEDLVGNYTDGPARYRLGPGDATDEVRRRAHRFYGAYLVASGARRVLDKYPEMVFRAAFVRAVFPDARFLFLVRDGWNTCRSVAQWSRTHGDERADWWGRDERKWRLLVEQVVATDPDLAPALDTIAALQEETDRAAVEWILTMRAGLELSRQAPDATHVVRYEALTEAPEETLRAIFAFCGLPVDERVLSYARAKLRPSARHEPLELHPALRTAFGATMDALGYA